MDARAVLALLAGGLVLAERGRAPDPAALGPLAVPFAERWARPADDVLAVTDGVVVVTSVASATRSLRGLDAVTGDELWSVRLHPTGPADSCTAGVTLEPPTAWCARDEHWVAEGGGGSHLAPPALVAVDARDGTVGEVRELPGASGNQTLVDGDLLLAQLQDGVLTIRRVDPRGWRDVWAADVQLELRPGLGHRVELSAEGRFVVLRGPTTAVLDAADGAVLQVWGPPEDRVNASLDGADVAVGPDGFGAWVTAVEGLRLDSGTWFDASGTPVTELDGLLAEPVQSDGSVPRVLLVTRQEGRTLVGVDATSGADLWSLRLDGGRVVSRRDGAVLLATEGRLRSVEVLTGIERWSREVVGLRPWLAALSDGSTVVVSSVRDRRWMLDAFREADGQALWFAQVPGTSEIVFAAYPPFVELVSGRPVVWLGRTLVWVA